MSDNESEQIEGHSTGVLKGETLYDLTPLRPQYTVISHSYLRMMNNLKENALISTLYLLYLQNTQNMDFYELAVLKLQYFFPCY